MSYYIGVVENRNDNMFLGRCQVRVFGVHSEDKVLLPTVSLPWAIPLQSTNSAAMNGIGNNPLGLVEGSWVLVIFLDGDDCQQPVILGSLGGVPGDRANLWDSGDDKIVMDATTGKVQTQNVAGITSPDGFLTSNTTQSNLVDSSGNPVRTGSGGYAVTESATVTTKSGTTIATGDAAKVAFKWPWIMTEAEITKLRLKIRFRESSDNYTVINQIGFVGGYQFGAMALADLGYVALSIGGNNGKLKQKDYWLNKNGMDSLDKFLQTPAEQDAACVALFKKNFGYLKSRSSINENTTKKELCGILAAAHLVGYGGAAALVKGSVKKDGNGVTSKDYYDLGYACLDGDLPITGPTTDRTAVQAQTTSETANEKTKASQIETILKTKYGFKDPNGQYPLLSFIGEPDTSRLARHQNIKETIIPAKIQDRLMTVPMANTKETWKQSETPYNAIYPFNHVTESESGHVIEIDDSPNCERINIHHAAGTFTEIDANGTQVNVIKGDNFIIMERHGHVNISGNCVIHVEGNANVYVENNVDLQVDGNVLANVYGKVDMNVAGTMNLNVTDALQIKAKSINMETHTGDFDIKSASSLNAVTGSKIDFVGGGNFNVDAPNAYLNSGTTSASGDSTKTDLPPGPDLAVPIPPNFEELTLPNYTTEKDMMNYESDDPAITKGYMEEKLEKKELTEADVAQMDADVASPPPAAKTDNTPTTPKDSVYAPTPLKSADGNYPASLKLSPNFTLGQLMAFAQSPKVLVPQHGLSTDQIVSNLTNLAINCLEPIKKAYPGMILSSCLRKTGNAVSKSGGKPSQHEIGQAADMQFGGLDTYDVVIKLKNLIPFDQLILEYSNNYKTKWIHVSFNPVSNRGMTFTMNNNSTYKKPGDKGYFKLG